MLWSIISWIIVGGIAGWIASMIMKTNAQMGMFANIAAGIVGAFVVGFLVRTFTKGDGHADAFSIPGFIGAIVGACIVIGIIKLVSGRSARV